MFRPLAERGAQLRSGARMTPSDPIRTQSSPSAGQRAQRFARGAGLLGQARGAARLAESGRP